MRKLWSWQYDILKHGEELVSNLNCEPIYSCSVDLLLSCFQRPGHKFSNWNSKLRGVWGYGISLFHARNLQSLWDKSAGYPCHGFFLACNSIHVAKKRCSSRSFWSHSSWGRQKTRQTPFTDPHSMGCATWSQRLTKSIYRCSSPGETHALLKTHRQWNRVPRYVYCVLNSFTIFVIMIVQGMKAYLLQSLWYFNHCEILQANSLIVATSVLS